MDLIIGMGNNRDGFNNMDGFHNREHAFGEGLITAGAVCMLKLQAEVCVFTCDVFLIGYSFPYTDSDTPPR